MLKEQLERRDIFVHQFRPNGWSVLADNLQPDTAEALTAHTITPQGDAQRIPYVLTGSLQVNGLVSCWVTGLVHTTPAAHAALINSTRTAARLASILLAGSQVTNVTAIGRARRAELLLVHGLRKRADLERPIRVPECPT